MDLKQAKMLTCCWSRSSAGHMWAGDKAIMMCALGKVPNYDLHRRTWPGVAGKGAAGHCGGGGVLEVGGDVFQVRGRGGLGQGLVVLEQRQVSRVLLKVRLQPLGVEQLYAQLLGPRLPQQHAHRL